MVQLAQTDIANVAAAIGDPSRTKVLLALADGRALPPSALAAEAGVSNSTISGHLTKLMDANLLTVERDGRHRYYRLATTEVAEALEHLARIARPLPINSLRESTRTQALLQARLCYDHLAGRLGVGLMAALLDRGILVNDAPAATEGAARMRDASYRVTTMGQAALAEFIGNDVLPPRLTVRYCLDWAEQRPHLAGPLGGALTTRLFDLGWIRHGHARRVVKLTPAGLEGLRDTFGLASV
ncbi:metalloregulator ArsR/SmtB family transcription factor [Nocardia sp. NPDC051030]|uniref:ArsR/SmtB family transcription factor n=1 Tax=Nocardia sp. NPDC051030 TaxID=3155162 RepID=UPI00342FA2BE